MLCIRSLRNKQVMYACMHNILPDKHDDGVIRQYIQSLYKTHTHVDYDTFTSAVKKEKAALKSI